MKVAAAHLDDRTEAAIEGAAARRFDHVDLAAHHGVTVQHASIAFGQADFVAIEAVDRTRRVLTPAVARAIGKARDLVETVAALHRAQQLAKRQFAFAAHDVVDSAAVRHVGFGRQAGIVAANDDAYVGRSERTNSMIRSAVLRWKVITDRPTTSGLSSRTSRSTVSRTLVLHEDQVGDGDLVMGIDIARQRSTALRWACAPQRSACARTSRAWTEAEHSWRCSPDGPHDRNPVGLHATPN